MFVIPLSPGFEIEDVRESLECDVSWGWRVYFMTSVRGKKDGLQGGRNAATKICCRAVRHDEILQCCLCCVCNVVFFYFMTGQ
jgi:hypothetical protein